MFLEVTLETSLSGCFLIAEHIKLTEKILAKSYFVITYFTLTVQIVTDYRDP